MFFPHGKFIYFHLIITLRSTENMFGTYLEKADIIEKRGVPSYSDPDSALTNLNRYVQADISNFWAMLVGIYFPSVTGQYRHQGTPYGMMMMMIMMMTMMMVKSHHSAGMMFFCK